MVREDKSPELTMVLLGKTGAGKSASGNTILGGTIFESKKSSKSVTSEIKFGRSAVHGIEVAVCDTPGFFDTECSEEKVKQQCRQLIETCKSGPCVFLVVIKTDRFTEEEKRTVDKIVELLDEQQFMQSWILFTRGDELEDQTIEEFIDESDDLKEVVKRFGNRYHVFSNKIENRNNKNQVLALLKKVCSRFQNNFSSNRPSENPTHNRDLPEKRIVLLGKSGHGKSATGNTILGSKKFKSKQSFSSVTKECAKKASVVSGQRVSVIDTPGFFDTQMSPEDLAKEIGKSIYMSRPGPHAFLLVLPIGRFTEQEEKIIEQMETAFGPQAREYTIILFTHGDKIKQTDLKIQIKSNKALSKLVEKFGGRYHVFNNKNRTKNRDQVTELMEKIDRMLEKNNGKCYSTAMYEDAMRAAEESQVAQSETAEVSGPVSADSEGAASVSAGSEGAGSVSAGSEGAGSASAGSEGAETPEDSGLFLFLSWCWEKLLAIGFAVKEIGGRVVETVIEAAGKAQAVVTGVWQKKDGNERQKNQI